MTEDPSHNNHLSSVQLALPTKITGIVFWGMVLAGCLVAVYLLHARENSLNSQYKNAVLLVSNDVVSVLEKNDLDLRIKDVLAGVFIAAQENYDIEAMAFTYVGERYQFGERRDGQDEIIHSLRIHDTGGSSSYVETSLYIYIENLQDSISRLRKQMLLIIGTLVFLFGFILQRILQKVLSRPFINMVTAAQRCANGDNRVRFDEERTDEFGYMAKFINQALETNLLHQNALEISRKALFEEKERAEVTLRSIIDGVITTTADAEIQYMNPVAERLTGWSNAQADNILLNNVLKIIDEETGQLAVNPVIRCLAENVVEHRGRHIALIRYDGSVVPIEVSAAPMRNDKDEVIGAVVVLQDVSQSRHLTRQLSYQASHDALTGLLNRRMFEEHMESALINVKEDDRHHVLCFIDLDQFKIVNDTCGHMAGDELLRQIAILLRECIRDDDTLARLGGDEFGVLLESCPLSKASAVANKIRQKVKDYRFGWEDKIFEIGASIGVVNIGSDNVDMNSLMSAADVACYAAKDMGRNRIHIYEPTDTTLAERKGQMLWVTRIVEGLEQNNFVLYQQPEMSMDDSISSRHLEVLIRMRGPDDTLVAPDSFIPAAERYNLMPQIDRWVIAHVFEVLANDNRAKDERRVVAINLSGLTLVDEGLLDYILQAQKQYAIDLSEICFEITETAAISNLSKATQLMNKLKKQGCQFALDDFGSGLSSFGYLKNLPVDYIKIDGSFVVDMINDPIDRAMVEAITNLGHVMKIKIIAECVEDQATLDVLREIGVDYAQGYHIGRPVEMLV